MQSYSSSTQAIINKMRSSVLVIFKSNYTRNEGVPPINIYLLRLIFILMFFFLNFSSWSHIMQHSGLWENTDAAAWFMWASCAAISWIGIIRPLKMLPIVLFEIIYKTSWLLMIAYPLWVNNKLAGSSHEDMANVFMWVALPILAMPWKYFFTTYIFGKS
jgi:hypothetical protein